MEIVSTHFLLPVVVSSSTHLKMNFRFELKGNMSTKNAEKSL